MVIDVPKPYQDGTDLNQAVRFHARERRKSLAGVLELFRTHYLLNEERVLTATDATAATPIVITTSVPHGLVDGMTVTVTFVTGVPEANTTATVTVITSTTFSLDGTAGTGAYVKGGDVFVFTNIPVPLIDTGSIFPSRSAPVTFRTAVRITGAAPAGLIFEFGSDSRGCGLGISDRFLLFAAGGLTTEGSMSLFNNGVTLPIGLEMDIVCAVRPGDGRTRMWVNGTELARGTASGGDLGGDWSDSGDGSLAQIAAGTPPPGLGSINQAPVDFEVIEPLSVYIAQVPRHFV